MPIRYRLEEVRGEQAHFTRDFGLASQALAWLSGNEPPITPLTEEQIVAYLRDMENPASARGVHVPTASSRDDMIRGLEGIRAAKRRATSQHG